MNKKGFQLSINFLVIIILSLVLFGAGIIIFTKVMGTGHDFQASIDAQTSAKLEAAMDDGSLVVAPKLRLNGEIGKSVLFPFGFWNEFQDNTNFQVYFDNVNSSLDPQILSQTYNLKPNERTEMFISVGIDSDTKKGQPSFDVVVTYKDDSGSWQLYGSKKRFYVVIN